MAGFREYAKSNNLRFERGVFNRVVMESKTFYDHYNVKNTIVNEFTDDKTSIVVYKFWQKRKKYWVYIAEEKDIFLRFIVKSWIK